MATTSTLPKLITFDGEARSGKGTIVQATKDYIRDELDRKVMLIDAGQVFRVLVVGATRAGIDMEDSAAIDDFLGDDEEAERCVALVKAVYGMEKETRDKLLYTNEVGKNSAKIGARPLSQSFKDELLKKWLRDAAAEGFEIVLLDGRALEEVGTMLERQNLCTFTMGLYFTCDPYVGARRTLGYASTAYDALTKAQRTEVDELVTQIRTRNESDRVRKVQPIVKPIGAPLYKLPDVAEDISYAGRFMATIDTSADMTKDEMPKQILRLVKTVLEK